MFRQIEQDLVYLVVVEKGQGGELSGCGGVEVERMAVKILQIDKALLDVVQIVLVIFDFFIHILHEFSPSERLLLTEGSEADGKQEEKECVKSFHAVIKKGCELLTALFLLCQVIELLNRNGFDAIQMTTAGKLGVEKLIEAGTTGVFINKPTGEHNDIGVVVLADKVGNLRYPRQPGTDLLMLVERHGDAFSRTAHGNASLHLVLLNALSQLVAVSGIVAALFGVGAVVLVFNALLLKIFLDELLQRKSGVVRS